MILDVKEKANKDNLDKGMYHRKAYQKLFCLIISELLLVIVYAEYFS